MEKFMMETEKKKMLSWSGRIYAAILLLVASAGHGQNPLFGPKSYAVTPGAPQSFSESVSVDATESCDGKLAYVLVLQSGVGGAVDSAVVSLNGEVLLSENDFRLPNAATEIPIQLLPVNSLLITLKGGNPGSSLVVSIRKDIEENVAPPIVGVLSSKEQVYSGSIQVPDPANAFALHVGSGDESGAHRPKSFAVRLNGVVIATERSLVGKSFALRQAVDLQQNNTLSVEVKGDAGDVVSVAVRRELDESACGPKVFIDSPAAGSTVTSEDLVVRGHVVGKADAALVLNGRNVPLDLVHAGTAADPFLWTAILHPPSGPVELIANVKDIHGSGSSASESITFLRRPSLLTVNVTPAVGIVPFDGAVIVKPASSGVQSYDADLDGDGVFEISGVTALPDHWTAHFTVPGSRLVTIRARTPAGETSTATALVVGQTFAANDVIVHDRWRALRRAFEAQDVEAAVALFADGFAQQKYRDVFTKLLDRLPAIADGMSELPGAISINGYLADYLVTRVEDGRTRGYHLSFIRAADGFWKIADF
jgi:hypothetical protein